MPVLPEEGERPTDREAEQGADTRRFQHDPHEGPQTARGVESPNASHDEQPVLGPPHQRSEDPGGDRESRGKVVATAAIIGFGAARSG